jgi:hypothetical protein
MTTTTTPDPDAAWGARPVDSATRGCCGGIGAHAHTCAAGMPAQSSPSAEDWGTLIAALRAVLDRIDTPRAGRHGCRFGWCETPPGSPVDAGSHYSHVIYTPASVRDGDPRYLGNGQIEPLRVGAGLACEDREGEPVSVVLHITGGPYDLDAEAHLTLGPAVGGLDPGRDPARNSGGGVVSGAGWWRTVMMTARRGVGVSR